MMFFSSSSGPFLVPMLILVVPPGEFTEAFFFQPPVSVSASHRHHVSGTGAADAAALSTTIISTSSSMLSFRSTRQNSNSNTVLKSVSSSITTSSSRAVAMATTSVATSIVSSITGPPTATAPSATTAVAIATVATTGNVQVEVAFVVSSVLLLAGYHILLRQWENQQSSKSITSTTNNSTTTPTIRTWRQYQGDTREDWSRYVRESESWLYAIQSLRNAITAQTFLATTVLSLLTVITGKIWDILRSPTTVLYERRLLTIQLSSIAMTMLFSAYQFLQGVRLMTHAGFMFPVDNKIDHATPTTTTTCSRVDQIMRKSQNCQWLGLRWMYISLGPIFWAVGGSKAFFVVAVLLLAFFNSIDKEPETLCRIV